jgi:short-subunit dehydrogenase
MLATNVAAPLALTRDMLALLRAAAPSRVVNIGSMFGDIAFPLFAGYSATKFGLRGISDALRRELADDGIGITHVAPRAVRTPAFAAYGELEAPFAMKVDAPHAVARRIWDAVARDRDRVYPGPAEQLFRLVQHLAPGIIDNALAPRLRKARPLLASAETVTKPAL